MTKKKHFSSELALLIAILYNSLNLSLLVKGNFGISTLSSVPVVFSKVFTNFTLGNWTIIIQSLTLVVMLFIVRKFKLGYLLSFVIALFFGFFVDMWTLFLTPLPVTIGFRIVYFIFGLTGTGIGAAFFVQCGLPIQPFDLFVREVSQSTQTSLKKTRMIYDATSLSISLTVSLLMLKRLEAIGLGTILSVFMTGNIMHHTSDILLNKYTFGPSTKIGSVLYNIS